MGSAQARHLRTTRRFFLASSAAAVAGGWAATALKAAPPVSRRIIAANDKVNVAVVGAGGRGFADLMGLEGTGVNIVALCDCDLPHAAEAFKKYPEAKQYADWRKMLESERGIDA